LRNSRIEAHTLDWLVDIAPEQEVGALGPEVADHHYETGQQLALHVEVP